VHGSFYSWFGVRGGVSDNLRLRAAVRSVNDFPKPGIVFRDLTPILQDPELHKEMIVEHWAVAQTLKPTVVVGMESRGFWYGPQIAASMNVGFVPARKPGKLPCPTISQQYGLEYGKDEIHIHADAIKPGDRVLVIDDLLATGGTAEAVGKIVTEMGAEVEAFLFAIELEDLKGRERLAQFHCAVIGLLHF